MKNVMNPAKVKAIAKEAKKVRNHLTRVSTWAATATNMSESVLKEAPPTHTSSNKTEEMNAAADVKLESEAMVVSSSWVDNKKHKTETAARAASESMDLAIESMAKLAMWNAPEETMTELWEAIAKVHAKL